MKSYKLMSLHEFAELSRTTRDRLHHYDKLGLLTPKERGKNKYRYYSVGQIAQVNVIRTLLDLGLSLAEILDLQDRRTPEHTRQILSQQIDAIDETLEKWSRIRKLLLMHRQSIDSVSDIDERAVSIRFLPEERIMLGSLNDYSAGGTDYDALCAFYQNLGAKYPGLDLNYPVWGLFTEDQIKRGIWSWPDRYYFFNPDGPDARPAGQYAVGYTRGGYGNGVEVFGRVSAYIDKNGFEICGDAYKEYPLNEICIINTQEYLIRVMIAVRKKPAQARKAWKHKEQV